MKINNLQVNLLPHTPFLTLFDKFDLKRAMDYQGKIGAICYSEEGLEPSFFEDDQATNKRVSMMTNGEHQSVFEHINVGLYLKNSPKFLNMILNNEHQYSTSERSLRYTSIGIDDGLPREMIELYNKWNQIFFDKIKEKYSSCKTDRQIMKLAQENSRYLMPVTMATEMVHTIPLAQLNRVVKYMMDYAENGINGIKDDLHSQMVPHIERFIKELYRLNIIDDRLLSNRKHRTLSIFGKDISEKQKEFGEVYSTSYLGSFALLAQAQRHRTIYYQMERTEEKTYFIPPILEGDDKKICEWQQDMEMVYKKYGYIPQGEKVLINEKGTFDNFVLKMKERLCSAAQLEVAMQTEQTLKEYRSALTADLYDFHLNNIYVPGMDKKREILEKIDSYSKGARCTFPDYDCPRDCKFKEGKILTRKI